MDIFDEENKVTSQFWAYKKIGDKIKGTYISKRTQLNQLSGKDQIIYEIMTDDYDFWNIGGKPGIDMQMKRVKFGQIIGFEFTEERKSKTPGLHPTKVVQVFARPDIVNEEWLKEQEEAKAAAPEEEIQEIETEKLGDLVKEEDQPFPSKK